MSVGLLRNHGCFFNPWRRNWKQSNLLEENSVKVVPSVMRSTLFLGEYDVYKTNNDKNRIFFWKLSIPVPDSLLKITKTWDKSPTFFRCAKTPVVEEWVIKIFISLVHFDDVFLLIHEDCFLRSFEEGYKYSKNGEVESSHSSRWRDSHIFSSLQKLSFFPRR